MECRGSSRFSSATSQPVWDTTIQALITSLRAFLRFLNFCGEFRDDLALAIPAVAHWRLARLPHCLSAEEVDRLIAACNGTDPRRLRDRAILLMLARLGFRAGDVACLRVTDIDWKNGTLQVTGKADTKCGCHSRRMSATLCSAIWNAGPRNIDTDHVFIRSIAPTDPLPPEMGSPPW